MSTHRPMLRGARSLITRQVPVPAPPPVTLPAPSPVRVIDQGLELRVARLEQEVESLRAELRAKTAGPPPVPEIVRSSSAPSSECVDSSPSRFGWSAPLSSPEPAAPSPEPAAPSPEPIMVKGCAITNKASMDQLQLLELRVSELHALCSHFNVTPPSRCKKQGLVTLLNNIE